MTDTIPVRIQLRRIKGWRMPENTIVVARPTRWGNPFPWQSQRNLRVTEREMRCEVVEMYREHRTDNPGFIADARTHLRGKNLACWCPLDQPCHADVLLEIANG